MHVCQNKVYFLCFGCMTSHSCDMSLEEPLFFYHKIFRPEYNFKIINILFYYCTSERFQIVGGNTLHVLLQFDTQCKRCTIWFMYVIRVRWLSWGSNTLFYYYCYFVVVIIIIIAHPKHCFMTSIYKLTRLVLSDQKYLLNHVNL